MSQAFPTSVSEHDLTCARMLAENARQQLAEAYRLLQNDPSLCVQAESAGKAVAHLVKGVGFRMPETEQLQ